MYVLLAGKRYPVCVCLFVAILSGVCMCIVLGKRHPPTAVILTRGPVNLAHPLFKGPSHIFTGVRCVSPLFPDTFKRSREPEKRV